MLLLSPVFNSNLLTYSPLFVSILLAAAIVWIPAVYMKGLDTSSVPKSLLEKSQAVGRFLLSPLSDRVYLAFQGVIVVAVVAGFCAKFASGGTPLFPLDDAYITMHNAEVLRSGHDSNYVNVPALVGATSSVHLLLVAFLRNFFKPEWALEASSWLGLLAYATGLAKLGKTYGASLLQTSLLLIGGIGAGKVLFQVFNGLETGLGMGGVAWALATTGEIENGASSSETSSADTPVNVKSAKAFLEKSKAFFPLVLLGILPFIRPELCLLTVLTLSYRTIRRFQSEGERRQHLNNSLLELTFVCVGAAPWILLSLWNTGSPMPQTMSAKRAFFSDYWPPHFVFLGYSRYIVSLFYVQVGAVLLGFFLLPFKKMGRLVFGFIALFVLSYLLILPVTLSWNAQRYLYLLIPFLIFGFAVNFRNPKVRIQRVGNTLLLATVLQAVCALPANWNEHTAACEFDRKELIGVRTWCLNNLPTNSRIMVHDAGAISCETSFVLTDFVGLKSPECAEINRRITLPSGGKRRVEALETMLNRSKAQYMILLDSWNLVYKISGGLKERGWRLEPLRGRDGVYQVYRISHTPGAQASN